MYLTKNRTTNSSRASTENQQANEAISRHQYVKAMQGYRAAIEHNPELPVYYSNLALAWERLFPVSKSKALEEVEGSAEHSPDSRALEILTYKSAVQRYSAWMRSPRAMASRRSTPTARLCGRGQPSLQS